MLAGAKYRGEFEDRLKAVLKEIKESNSQTIMFIDERHTVVGAVAAEGSVDASNMLKPALARGELRCIGATTINEFRKYIEKDAALERRFQPVMVKEPTVEDTISILRGLKERYEVHHGVRIKDSAIVAAATPSHRYISNRFLPDKAVDLSDEAASSLRMEIDRLPSEIDEVQRKIIQLEIEREALKKEKDKASKERLNTINNDIKDLKNKYGDKKKQWEKEKSDLQTIRNLKESIEEAKIEEQRAERNSDLEKVAEIRYSIISALQKELEKENNKLEESNNENKMLKEEIDTDDIAEIVSKWTGIPAGRMLEGEIEKLVHMEERINKRVIGQDNAVTLISNAVRRERSGLQDPDRPLGSFIFLGPTGVGKTELARALAEFLFDEFEKAHPDVFNILLQIMDDGRLTDGHGRTVDFKNAIIILTSNLGSNIIQETSSENRDEKVMEILRQTCKPEFLNRLDEVIIFNSRERDHIKKIVGIQLDLLRERLDDKKTTLELTDKALDFIANHGYEPVYGARPLKRAIQKHIQDSLAMMILEGKYKDGSRVTVDAEISGDKLNFIT